MNIVVSIVVTCYNYGDFVSECLSSISQQTFLDWECIVVDDGSTDNSKDMIVPFTSDKRFSYVWQENGNVSKARNNGLNKAKGEYVICIDADDKIAPNFIEALWRRFNKDASIDLVYPEVELFGIQNGIWKLPPYSYQQMLVNNMIVVSSMYRRSDFLKYGGYDTHMITGSEDWEFWLRLLNNDKKVVKASDAIVNYRIKKSSKNTNILSSQEVKKQTYRYITKKHIDIYSELFESPLVLYHELYEAQVRESEYFRNPFKAFYNKIASKAVKFFSK